MAVRHGYGKLSGLDALVFAYDTGDTRNSYRGEPTTNLITDTSDFGNSFWNQKSGTFTANDAVGPRGIQNAAKIVAVNTDPYIYSSAVVTVTAGSVTWSIWVKGTGDTVGKSAEARINFSGTASGTDNNVSITLTDQWQLLQVSATATGGGTIKFGLEAPNGAVSGDIMYFADPMFEQKAHATQFVNGTRSATQGLLDLTGTNDITVNNVSFDSNAQMYFDGTDDVIGYVYVGISDYSEPFTMECVFMVDPAATWANSYRSNIFGIAGSYAGMYGLNKHSTDSVGLYIRDASGGAGCDVSGLSKGVYYHLIGTWDGTNDIRIYLNGTLRNTTTSAKSGAPDSTSIWIGGTRAYSGAGGQTYHGEIPVAKYYNRVLTAQEVLTNFNLYKGRFGM